MTKSMVGQQLGNGVATDGVRGVVGGQRGCNGWSKRGGLVARLAGIIVTSV